VILYDKHDVVVEDVGIGKSVCVKFKGEKKI